jgi:hypothetical protein
VNINKAKALLVHDVVAPLYPKVKYKGIKIDFTKCFKYLGVDITTKLGWEICIPSRSKKIRKIYHAVRILVKGISISLIKLKRKLFFTYALRHVRWLLPVDFFIQKYNKG